MQFLMPVATNRRRTPKMGMHFSNKIYVDHENVQDSFRKYRIKKLKIMHPVSQAQCRWFIDIFEEYDFLLDVEKKKKIAALRISDPVAVSKWNNDNDWYTHSTEDSSK